MSEPRPLNFAIIGAGALGHHARMARDTARDARTATCGPPGHRDSLPGVELPGISCDCPSDCGRVAGRGDVAL